MESDGRGDVIWSCDVQGINVESAVMSKWLFTAEFDKYQCTFYCDVISVAVMMRDCSFHSCSTYMVSGCLFGCVYLLSMQSIVSSCTHTLHVSRSSAVVASLLPFQLTVSVCFLGGSSSYVFRV